MKNFYKIISFALIISIVPFSAGAYYFTSDLKVGDQNADVYELQKQLNKDSDTTVATVGIGSLGNETYYFGNLTKTAVIHFQEKYYSEVLAPAGLFSGSGFVGAYTRKKLNQIVVQASSSAVQASQTIQATRVNQTSQNNNTSAYDDAHSKALITDYILGADSSSTSSASSTISTTTLANLGTNSTLTVGSTTITLNKALEVLGGAVQSKVDQQLKNVKSEKVKQKVRNETKSSYSSWSSGLISVGSILVYTNWWNGIGALIGLVLIAAGLILGLFSGGNVAGVLLSVAGGLIAGPVGSMLGGVVGGVAGGLTGGSGSSSGGAEIPFGGLHLASLNCSCSGGSVHYIWDYRTNSMITLYYQKGQSKLYDNNNINGTYQLGTYRQGGGMCQIEAGEECESIDTDGTYGSMPGTGTSQI